MLRILVVDDDPNSSALLKLLLTNEGHDVQCADSASLAIVQAAANAPHLLISDLVFQNGSHGLELAAGLRRQNDRLAVIFTTGMSAADVRQAPGMLEHADILEKPVDLDRLLVLVKHVAAQMTDGDGAPGHTCHQ